MTKQEYINTVAPLVVKVNKERGFPLFSSVPIAQSILETGWGKSSLMMKANAIFGIKATKNWKGKVYSARTKECYDGVNFTSITDLFRAYNSLEESINDYFDLITKTERYRKACSTNTPRECITEIKKGGYATDPNYVASVMTLINQNNLTRFDDETRPANIYEVKKTYKTYVDLRVRSGAGTNYPQKLYKQLTLNAKLHSYKQEKAVLKAGTKVTCLETQIVDGDIWIRIPSGWIAGFYNNKYYVK